MISEPTLEDILNDEATRLLMRSDAVRVEDVRRLMANLTQGRTTFLNTPIRPY